MMMVHRPLKRSPTENCRAARVCVTGRGPLQPCRNGAIARRGRGKRRPARAFALRDADAKVRFSVGNNFSADARKTVRAHAVRAAERKRIAAYSPRLRLMPRAHAPKFQPIKRRGPKRGSMEDEPSDDTKPLLRGIFGVGT